MTRHLLPLLLFTAACADAGDDSYVTLGTAQASQDAATSATDFGTTGDPGATQGSGATTHGTGATDDTDPTEPTAADATDPTGPTEPTIATDATDPTEPTATDATDPTAPTTATDATDSTDSTDTTEPTDSIDTTDGETDEFPANAIFVRESDGPDSNPGTQEEPKRTIQAGIEAAAELVDSAVFIAEGSYEADSSNNDAVNVVDGVSIFGGYKIDDWDARDPAAYPTVLADTSEVDALPAEPNRAIYVGPEVGADTVVDGLRVHAATGARSTAAFVRGDAQLRNNLLTGGPSQGMQYGALVEAGAPTFRHNEIHGANPMKPAIGVHCRDDGAPVFEGNFITTREGDAIYSSYCDVTFINNIMANVEGPASTNVANLAGEATLINNTIVHNGDGFAVGVVGGSKLQFDNNIVSAANGCVNAAQPTVLISSLSGNDLSCQYVFLMGNFMGFFTGTSAMETALQGLGTQSTGNVKVAPVFVEVGVDYHLAGAGETDCDISLGALSLPMSLEDDHDGAPRTEPWTMGAFEYDGPCK